MEQDQRPALSRRTFLGMAAAMSAAGIVGAAGPSAAAQSNPAPSRRPNLLFVFSDQQSRDMVGCYGNEGIITPHLDRFAAEGVKFEHCVSSCPVCSPYRSMLLSGQHPFYNGVVHNDVPLLANNGVYFGDALKQAGYKTGYVGKWHVYGGDRDRPVPRQARFGFEDYFLSNNCHVNFMPGKCFYWNEQGEKVFFDEWEAYGQTHQAEDFLEGCSRDEPFALFVSWHPPHDQGLDPESLVFKYPMIPEMMSKYDPAKIRLRPSAPDTPAVREAYHGYYANCTGIDEAFGGLMQKLKEKGLDDNTIVVFTSDHGDNLNSYNFTLPKDHPEDTACRVPMMVRWPGRLKAGAVSNLPVGTLDLMPTLLGMLGIEPPSTCQGTNLAKAIETGDDDAQSMVPLFFNHPMWRGVYTRDVTYAFGQVHQFHRGPGDKGPRLVPRNTNVLYDRRNDPDQLRNLFRERSARPLREKMNELTWEWMDRLEDPMPDFEHLWELYGCKDLSYAYDTQAENFRGRPIDLIKKFNL